MEIDMPYAWIPPGQFLMGGSGNDNEKPQRRVTLTKGFWMGIHPVTQKQFEGVMGYNPSQFKGDTRPVEQVSWEDAQEFCKKLRELTGKPIRLPTEAEWEYACRAGEGGDYHGWTGEEALKAVGWYTANSNNQTQPVGQKKPNKWGLFDMHGNVWDWCQDWYDEMYYPRAPEVDPLCVDGPKQHRVLRGASWIHDPGSCRAAFRCMGVQEERNAHIGFRVVFCLD